MAPTFQTTEGKFQLQMGTLDKNVDIELWDDESITFEVDGDSGTEHVYTTLDDLKAIIAEHEKFLQARKIYNQGLYIQSITQH